MKNYINGAIREAIWKGRSLMAKIPGARKLGRYFPTLATIANREIQQLIDNLEHLYNDPDYNDDRTTIREKFSRFKKLSGELSDIENVVIAAISRIADDDEFVNELVYEICKEINYPLPNPVASCLSQKYYVWSNIHMCTKMSWEIFKIPTFQIASHPPDEAVRIRISHL